MTAWARREARFLGSALTLLTRLPAPRLRDFEEEWLAHAPPYFPLIGLLVGLIAALAYGLARLLWPEPVAWLLALAAAALATGGFHEDGWADVADGFAAGGGRARILEVMRDPRVGGAGALALALLVAAKLAGLAALPAAEVPAALVAAHVLSRWATLPLLWRLPYARPQGEAGTARPLAGRLGTARLVAGTLLAVLLAALALRQRAVPVLLAAAAVALAARWFFRRRLGGITGDCLGATGQLVEVVVLLALAARLRPVP